MDNRTPCSLKETQAAFDANRKKLIGSLFNYLFVLDIKGALSRKRILQALFIVIWGILTILMLYGTGVSQKLGDTIQNIFQVAIGNTTLNISIIESLFATILRAIFDPWIILIIPIILLPFVLAYQRAVDYLVDIYELEDPEIAAKFIWQAAFASEYNTISVVEGKITEKDQNSPIVRIGGPGVVNVDFCSAVLFEKPNGRPHVIGPTYKPPPKKNTLQKYFDKLKKKLFTQKKLPSGNKVLGGFERYRYAKNLRNEALAPIDVNARTREGIPVIAKDVRMVYSIWRGNPSEEEKKAIYPFHKAAIPSFFYSASCTVSKILAGGCTISPVDPMPGIVKGALGNFVAERSLSEFLTAVGAPEKKALEERAKAYKREKDTLDRIANPTDVIDLSGKKFQVPDFTPRYEANPLLSQFADEFSANNRQKGVTLHWLGAGTWVVPHETIAEKNEEAKAITKENRKNGSKEALDKVEKNANKEERLRLIRQVPMQAGKIMYAPSSLRKKVIRETLNSYVELIRNASRLVDIYDTDESEGELRESASVEIYNVLKHHSPEPMPNTSTDMDIETWVRKALRQAIKVDKDAEIQSLYSDLLRRTLGDTDKVIRLIAQEKKESPNLTLKALMKNAIER